MDDKFLVIKWDSIESKLNGSQLDLFYGFLNIIGENESENDELFVITKAEKDIIEVKKNEVKEKKKKLIEILEELRLLKDVETAHAEADEALLNYINDSRISELFDSIGK